MHAEAKVEVSVSADGGRVMEMELLSIFSGGFHFRMTPCAVLHLVV